MTLLNLTPVPSAQAYEQNERIVVVRPKPVTRGLRASIDWLIYALAPRRVRLDDFGSFCWRHMDGQRTAGEIASLLRARFGSTAEPAEERLGRFIHMLQREVLVRFETRPRP